jgi:zinc-ribbon domain
MKIDGYMNDLKPKVRNMALSLVVTCGMLAALPFAAVISHAAEPLGLKNVIIKIDPEYDDSAQLGVPSVLVMMDGEIVGTNAPATVRFLVPTDATLYSAGSGPRTSYVRGDNLTLPPKQSSIPGRSEASFDIRTQHFVVEYYEPIKLTQNNRNFTYDFRPEYPVSDLTVSVQEPLRSSNYTVTAGGNAQGITGTDQDQLKTHTYTYTNIAAAADAATRPTVYFAVSYTKTDTRPSLGNLGGEVGAGGGGSNRTAIILLVLGGIVVLSVGFAIVKSKFGSSSKQRQTNLPRKGSTARLNQHGGKGDQAKGGRFCTQCGQPVEPDDRFCPYCGSKLKS